MDLSTHTTSTGLLLTSLALITYLTMERRLFTAFYP